MSDDRLIRASEACWNEYHRPSGDTLEETKIEWRELLDEDPQMQDAFLWGPDLACPTDAELRAFTAWLPPSTGAGASVDEPLHANGVTHIITVEQRDRVADGIARLFCEMPIEPSDQYGMRMHRAVVTDLLREAGLEVASEA